MFRSMLVLAGLAVAPLALADDPTPAVPAAPTAPAAEKPDATASFEKLDANEDKKLEEKEVASVPDLKAGFADADTNKDKALSLEEYSAWVAKG